MNHHDHGPSEMYSLNPGKKLGERERAWLITGDCERVRLFWPYFLVEPCDVVMLHMNVCDLRDRLGRRGSHPVGGAVHVEKCFMHAPCLRRPVWDWHRADGRPYLCSV